MLEEAVAAASKLPDLDRRTMCLGALIPVLSEPERGRAVAELAAGMDTLIGDDGLTISFEDLGLRS